MYILVSNPEKHLLNFQKKLEYTLTAADYITKNEFFLQKFQSEIAGHLRL